jgi:hypothetical protein
VSRPTRGPSSRFPVRGCHPLWPAFPDASGTKDHGHWPVPRSLATTDGISRRRLSPPPSRAACATRMLMSVPPATEMFQFAGFASCTYEFSTGYPYGWVSPFGDPGITDRSHLPRAFRSVPRPSSPLSAKASTRCPCFALDQTHRRHRRCHTTAAHRAKPQQETHRAKPMPFPQPREAAVSHEDTSLGHTPEPALLAPPPTGEARLRRKGRAKHSCPGPVRLGHITTLSSPFNQPRRTSTAAGVANLLRAPFSQRRRMPRPTLVCRWYFSAQLCRACQTGKALLCRCFRRGLRSARRQTATALRPWWR